MTNQNRNEAVQKILTGIEKFIPFYMQDPIEKAIANGNVAICIIDETGSVHGKMYGMDKPRLRQSYKIAWTKASQVWLTGMKTGAYERLVFNKEIPENADGIEAPDLIGWEGGQPVTLSDGTKLSIGFSGFRGVVDLEIVVRAIQENNL
jgi:uncharacterized protein GlcG (DUF336 family)